jgi:glycosyltransferase involved in cell wall biosynthesis
MTDKPRIIMVRSTSVANATAVITLANHLSGAGCEVTIVCLQGNSSPVEGLSGNVEVMGLGCSMPSGLGIAERISAAYKLRRTLASRNFDVLYVIDSWTLHFVWLATGGRFRYGKTCTVYHAYDWLDPSLHAKIHLRLERRMCRAADLVINTDRARARLQRSFYGLKVTPLWIQNCLPGNTPLPHPNPALRRELLGASEDDDCRLVVYPTVVSNESSAERLTYSLVKAFTHLPSNYRLATFFKEGIEYRRCLGLAEADGLQTRVKFLPPVPFAKLMAYLGSADIGAILYDDCHSSGYFMANADKLSVLAAAGVPFVASDYPNLESVTYRYDLGICCDGKNPTHLARSIRELAEGPISLAERKKHVRRMFEEHLTFEKHGPRLVEALGNILCTRKGSRREA